MIINEYKLEERHRANRAPQPIHKSSPDSNTQFLFPKIVADSHSKSFGKARSNTMLLDSEDFKFNPFEEDQSASDSIRNEEEDASLKKATEQLLASNTKSGSTSLVFIQKGTEQDLKDKLADSLSPSPFKRDAKLEELVASVPCTTKTLISSSFFGSELMGDNGHRAWKIALKDYIANTLEAICIIRELDAVPVQLIEKKRLPVDSKASGKKLIVFDLDETLVHCNTDDITNSDKIITVTLNNGEQVKAGVNIRPYAVECLKELAEFYELIVFTASHPFYANVVIDLLDPHNSIFSKRLFRSSCIQTDINVFIKDLRILNYDPKSTVIIDNSILSFAFQLDNGIPIIPFYDDKEDRILIKIKDYLLSLKDVQDVRVINRKNFSLQELYDLNPSGFVKYYKKSKEKIEEAKEVILEETEELNCARKEFMRKKSCSFRTPNNILITEEAQAEVDHQLTKLQESLPKYLAKQNKI